MPGYATTNREKAKEILSALGSNVLLLDCFNDELIDWLKPLFGDLQEASGAAALPSYDDQESGFEVLFYAFLDTIDHFDSSFDVFDSSVDFGGGDYGGGDFGGDFGGGDY